MTIFIWLYDGIGSVIGPNCISNIYIYSYNTNKQTENVKPAHRQASCKFQYVSRCCSVTLPVYGALYCMSISDCVIFGCIEPFIYFSCSNSNVVNTQLSMSKPMIGKQSSVQVKIHRINTQQHTNRVASARSALMIHTWRSMFGYMMQ